MNIAVAPHMPIIANGGIGNIEFDNLTLLDLPSGVTLYVPEKWDEFLTQCPSIIQNSELYSRLLELNVQEVTPVKKAQYIKLDPDILISCSADEKDIAKQQLFSIYLHNDAKRIFAGITCAVDEFLISYNKGNVYAQNFNPNTGVTLKEFIDSFAPKLCQLKHNQDPHKYGGKDVSPFSAYDKYNEDYAKQLLKRAYEEYPGNIDDRTYLYTYDSQNKTFVEFRPMRQNEYHGIDISREDAFKKCPYIVKLYHK